MTKTCIALAVLLVSISTVSAQEAGMFGLMFRVGSSSSVGFIYTPIDNFALRPFVSFSINNTMNSDQRDDQFNQSENDRTGTGGGLNFQYYFNSTDDFMPYIGIGGTYSTSKDVSAYTQRAPGVDTTIERTTTTRSVGGNVFFGVQYNIVRWLAVHGEIVANYSTRDSEYSEFPLRKLTNKDFSLSNSGFGATIYF